MQHRTALSHSRNRILSLMDGEDVEFILPHLEPVDLPVRFEIDRSMEALTQVIFPEEGLGSIIATGPQERRIEVGVFGRDGVSGSVLAMGGDRSPDETIIQVPGHGYRLSAMAMRSLLDRSARMRQIVLNFHQSMTVQMAQTLLSNGHGTVEERLARWLIMCHDRLVSSSIVLTHEFLSIMLGVRRAGVTVAIHALEGRHLIRATRGRIDILDREGLVRATNGSYGIAEAEYGRLLGLPGDLSRATLG